MKTILIKTFGFALIFVMGSLYNSCKKEENDNDNNINHTIGETYGGGIVFYIDDTGKHGLLASSEDQPFSDNMEWGCEGTSISVTSTAVGKGQANTTAIINGCSTAGIVALLCDQLELNGFSDWFLPSKDELNLMYQNLHRKDLGDFLTGLYWSSSEVDKDNVWVQNFWDESPFFEEGEQLIAMKHSSLLFRAIRAF